MNEEQLGDRFRRALADEPTLGFDPDDVVDRAVRATRRRSAMIGAATAAAAVVLGVVTVLQVFRVDSGVSGFGSAPTSKPTITKPTDPCDPPGTKSPEPTGTKPSEPPATKPTGTKPAETKPSEPDSSVPKPTETKPRPSGTKPIPPSCKKPPQDDPGKVQQPFTGWEQAVQQFERVVPPVLADKVPGTRFDSVGVKPYDDRRCVAGAYWVNGDGYSAVSVSICHEQKIGLGKAPAAGGDWGPVVSDTANPDGSHLQLYKFSDGAGAKGVAVAHVRPDGVVVQVDTGYKSAHGKTGPVLSQEQLTAIAADPRLTF
jgi:hypothetical protein